MELSKEARMLFRLTKSELVSMILNYESKLHDMELEDMIESPPNHKKEANKAMKRFTAKLKKEKEEGWL